MRVNTHKCYKSTLNKRHRQVPAKVAAFVDDGIKELVELLNTYDNVWSSSSCEGTEDKPAYVYLHYGHPKDTTHEKVAIFACKLARALSEYVKESGEICSPSSSYDIRVALQWLGDKKYPTILIEVPKAEVEEATRVFYDVRRRFCDNTQDK